MRCRCLWAILRHLCDFELQTRGMDVSVELQYLGCVIYLARITIHGTLLVGKFHREWGGQLWAVNKGGQHITIKYMVMTSQKLVAHFHYILHVRFKEHHLNMVNLESAVVAGVILTIKPHEWISEKSSNFMTPNRHKSTKIWNIWRRCV